jgi:hypothetical protein
MRNGQIAGELPAGPTEAEIMFLATGEEDIEAETEADLAKIQEALSTGGEEGKS